jgi:8-oxo-dGTP pyrophosphatase MutT (NUDIX family)
MSILRETSAAILIDDAGRFLLQQREDKPEILYPGMIGLFGGHREGDETFLQCVVREVFEEISLFLPPERFVHLITYSGNDPGGGTLHAEIFIANDVPVDRLVITEGALLSVRPEDIAAVANKFSPVARFAVNAFTEHRHRRPRGTLRTNT